MGRLDLPMESLLMPSDTLPSSHRVILCHFDGYSTALLFARWSDGSLLWPGPLPPGAAPAQAEVPNDGEAARQAVLGHLPIPDEELVWVKEFDQVLQADGQAFRVHLLRFETFEAPGALIEPAGGVFKHLPGLRGSAPVELNLLREVFNLMVGGGGQR